MSLPRFSILILRGFPSFNYYTCISFDFSSKFSKLLISGLYFIVHHLIFRQQKELTSIYRCIGFFSDFCRSVRCNVELDTPRLIKFSPDNKSFIVSLENGNNIRVYKMNKSEDGGSVKIQPAFENDFQQV